MVKGKIQELIDRNISALLFDWANTFASMIKVTENSSDDEKAEEQTSLQGSTNSEDDWTVWSKVSRE